MTTITPQQEQERVELLTRASTIWREHVATVKSTPRDQFVNHQRMCACGYELPWLAWEPYLDTHRLTLLADEGMLILPAPEESGLLSRQDSVVQQAVAVAAQQWRRMAASQAQNDPEGHCLALVLALDAAGCLKEEP